ncbi:MAG: TIGR03915 family putative DNA repair protein [Eggerthellaceae bacterium]|nr:TIGR03915 family putative DNA repair protein [Eggerthellaceae bacterium]
MNAAKAGEAVRLDTAHASGLSTGCSQANSSAYSDLRGEPLQQVAYLYDGSLEGLLCCVFEAYSRHEDPEDIVPEAAYQPRFEQSSFFVSADYERALRVRRGVEREAGKKAFSAIAYAAANDNPKTGIAVYRFIRYVMDGPKRNKRRSALNDLSNPVVADLVALEKHVVKESERMRQFVRFSQLENGVWFARCNPNANVVPLVMNHFASRFNIQPFIIFDEVHHISGVYDGNTWYLVADDVVNVPARSAEDAFVEALWQQFYDSLSISSRYNPELRRHFMPVRLWKNIPELHPVSKSALQKNA